MWDRPASITALVARPEHQAALVASDAIPAGVPALAEATELEVLCYPSPFSRECIYVATPAGLTLTELAALAGLPAGRDARVFILHGAVLYGPIPRADWDRLRPQPGRRVLIRALLSGGGQGDSNKSLRLALQLVVMVASLYVGGAAGAVLNLLGQWAIVALLAPPPPRLRALAGVPGANAASAAFSITGSMNRANPYGAIPKIYGRHRMFPPVGAMRPRRGGRR